MRTVLSALLMGLLMALAFTLRSLEIPSVFPGDGSVLLERADGSYHARRAYFSFKRFPTILFFDPYLNYPDGSPVPWPPLYDLALGGVARVFGDTDSVFEHVAAWTAPVLATLTLLPIRAAARTVGGAGVGLGAATIFAVLPAAVAQAYVGNPDHHAAVMLLVAIYVAASLAQARPETTPGRRTIGIAAGLLLTRVLVALCWSGSLLYLAIGESALLLAAVIGGRRDLLATQCVGTAGAALLVIPWIVAGGVPAGGPFSTITLSWFHVMALAAVSIVSGSLALLEILRPSSAVAARVLRAALIGLLVLGALLARPEAREALAPAASFLSKQDEWGSERNLEARSLFGPPIPGATVPRLPAHRLYGAFAYLLPLAGLAVLLRLRIRRVRAPALVLACWTLSLGVLAVREIRFSGDFAPTASIAFTLLLAEVRAPFARRTGRPSLANAGALLAGLLLLWPSFGANYRDPFPLFLRRLRDPVWPGELTWRRAGGSLVRFARTVRELTPETAGYLDPSHLPEYGILAPASLGHVLHYVARRATPVDPFGPYLDARKFREVRRFLAADSEAEALEIARHLSTPFIVTAAHRAAAGFEKHLHVDDGKGRGGRDRLEHFRLIAEGPAHGQPLMPMQTRVVPYKLWEVVEGAVLEARTSPGTPLLLAGSIRTPTRRFLYGASVLATGQGVARLRVPYATETRWPVQPEGPFRVRIGSADFDVEITDADVAEGRVLPVGGAR